MADRAANRGRPDVTRPTHPIAAAVEILRAGGIVAFPTETVYGLGADARSPDAVDRIFAAKGRPNDNPLIVHVADVREARRCARVWPKIADELAGRFWPGPLTLVVAADDRIARRVTAGGETVGLRSPDHPIALALLRAFDGPIAAPSANRSNRISPTTAEHVRRELGEAVTILDGGPCRVGIESTVLDLSRERPAILRPGGISRPEIETVIGPLESPDEHLTQGPARSPGNRPVHYSPVAPAYRFHQAERGDVLRWLRKRAEETAVILPIGEWMEPIGSRHQTILMPPDPQAYASRLYSALREADDPGVAAIFIELPPPGPEWEAVHDRIRRATRPAEGMFGPA